MDPLAAPPALEDSACRAVRLDPVIVTVIILTGWLAGWLAGRLAGWLAGWLVGWSVGWLAGAEVLQAGGPEPRGGERGLPGPPHC